MLTPERFAEVAARDIAFARDLFRAVDRQFTVPAAIAEDLGIAEWPSSEEMSSLQSYIQDKGPLNPLRNEIGVLSFAEKFISHLHQGNLPEDVTHDRKSAVLGKNVSDRVDIGGCRTIKKKNKKKKI